MYSLNPFGNITKSLVPELSANSQITRTKFWGKGWLRFINSLGKWGRWCGQVSKSSALPLIENVWLLRECSGTQLQSKWWKACQRPDGGLGFSYLPAYWSTFLNLYVLFKRCFFSLWSERDKHEDPLVWLTVCSSWTFQHGGKEKEKKCYQFKFL
jgi:hypothetical protein